MFPYTPSFGIFPFVPSSYLLTLATDYENTLHAAPQIEVHEADEVPTLLTVAPAKQQNHLVLPSFSMFSRMPFHRPQSEVLGAPNPCKLQQNHRNSRLIKRKMGTIS